MTYPKWTPCSGTPHTSSSSSECSPAKHEQLSSRLGERHLRVDLDDVRIVLDLTNWSDHHGFSTVSNQCIIISVRVIFECLCVPWVFSCSCLGQCPTVWHWFWLERSPLSECRKSAPARRNCRLLQYSSPKCYSHTPTQQHGGITWRQLIVCQLIFKKSIEIISCDGESWRMHD